MRGVRFLLEFQKTEEILRRWAIRSTVVVFGSARAHENGNDHWARWYAEARRFGYICDVTARKRMFAPVPWPLAMAKGFGLEMAHKLSLGIWPEWLTVTRDQIRLLQSDNVVSDEALAEGRTLAGLGITPTAIEAIVPSYLYRFRKAGQFTDTRAA